MLILSFFSVRFLDFGIWSILYSTVVVNSELDTKNLEEKNLEEIFVKYAVDTNQIG